MKLFGSEAVFSLTVEEVELQKLVLFVVGYGIERFCKKKPRGIRKLSTENSLPMTNFCETLAK